MKRRKRKYTHDPIKRITRIRAKNNLNWMEILELALEVAPKRARNIIKRINQRDQEVTKWLLRI